MQAALTTAPTRKRGKRYTEEELATLVQRELDQSLGAADSEVAALRERNLTFYRAQAEGELAPPEAPDRSSVVSTDVPDTIEWMLPSLVRVFVQSKDAMTCAPKHPRFVPGAKMAAEYLRHVFWKKNPGFLVIYQWVKDALVQKVGFVKVNWEDAPQDIEESYRGLLPQQVEEMLAEDGVEALEQDSRIETIAVTGQPPAQIEVFDLRVRRARKSGKCAVVNVPPEEMRVHSRARYSEDPLFIAQVSTRTRGELEAEDYDLDGVASGEQINAETNLRQNAQSTLNVLDGEGEFERFEFAECYIKLDQDNDGVPEWRRVVLIGGKVFEDEKVDGHPFVWVCPNPDPHVFFGQCPADFAVEPQRLGTSLLRGLMDNVYLTVNQRMGVVDGKVNLDDLTNNRPGGVVRMAEAGALVPIVQGGLDQGAWQMVEWKEQWREQRTGFTRYSQGLSPDALNPTATGVGIITEKADQRTELTARVIAHSVERMFTLILKCMGQYQQVEELVELNGQWVSVDPREWAEGYQIEVDVGLGTGSKDKKALALQQVYGMQQPLAQAGAIPPAALCATGRAFTEAVGLGDGNEYFPPPGQPQQPPPPPQVMVKQMELQADAQRFQAETVTKARESQQAHEQRMAELQAQMQLQASNDQRDAHRERLKAQMEYEQRRYEQEQDRYEADLNASIEKYKADLSALVALVGTGQGAPPEIDLAPLESALSSVISHLSAPVEIVRDTAGRMLGARRIPSQPPAA